MGISHEQAIMSISDDSSSDDVKIGHFVKRKQPVLTYYSGSDDEEEFVKMPVPKKEYKYEAYDKCNCSCDDDW